uniref:NADH:ubiquinone oxidoreductase intermediate-associated protein 30 domain-containing protein n=1 Tax=Coccolithus braarudii TaxID=221442 RepID=A0A7S0LVG7_9EUKA|mmetsp:Transcript_7859/g.17194  ORF Transcript_7859/g.17194 Transcript_7859/m.17194 type:complete len:244 (+) Transcript_7859:90-821(+)
MWGRVRRDVVRASLNVWSDPFALTSEATLISFRGGHSALKRWQLHSDAEHGGQSHCALTAPTDTSAMFSGHTSLEMDAGRAATSPMHKKPASKTGWCAMQTRVPEDEWDLKDFHGIRLTLRTDARHYVLNLRTAGLLDGMDQDVFQAHIPPCPLKGEWAQLRIPFAAFSVTWRGYMQGAQRSMNLEAISSVGVLIADRKHGDFNLEVDEISAFRFGDEEVQDPLVARLLRQNEELGYCGDGAL